MQTARMETSLGVARKKYKRLEADMFRSKIELADTLADAEKERNKHDQEFRQADEHAKELEVALRAADEVGQPDLLGFYTLQVQHAACVDVRSWLVLCRVDRKSRLRYIGYASGV